MPRRSRGIRRTNRRVKRNTMRRRNTNRKVRRNTNRKVRRNTNRKVRRNTNRKVRRNTMKRRNSRRNFRRMRGGMQSQMEVQPQPPIPESAAAPDYRTMDEAYKTMNDIYQSSVKYASLDPNLLEQLVDRGQHSGIQEAQDIVRKAPEKRFTLPKEGWTDLPLINKHLSKGSNTDPTIAKFTMNLPQDTPLSKIAAYHLGNTNFPMPTLKATGEGVSYFVDDLDEEGAFLEWPHDKTLKYFNPKLGATQRQTGDTATGSSVPGRPIAALHLKYEETDEPWVIVDNRDPSYPSTKDLNGKIVGTPQDGPSQGPNCCWLGHSEWLVNVFSSDPKSSRQEAISQVKKRINNYIYQLELHAGEVFLSYMKAQISYVYAGGDVGNSGPKQDASGNSYTGNSNFIDNMLPLFQKVCEAMMEKGGLALGATPPINATELREYGIEYKAMCQSWTRVSDDETSTILEADFSIPSPHSQILFYVATPSKLHEKVPTLIEDDFVKYAVGFEEFQKAMNEKGYINTFIFLENISIAALPAETEPRV